MNPQEQLNAVNKVNRVILGIFLLFVIIGSGVYGSIKFMEVYDLLSTPQEQNNVATKISEEEKENLLASVASSNADIDEKEKLTMLKNLSLESSIDINSRNTALESLK